MAAIRYRRSQMISKLDAPAAACLAGFRGWDHERWNGIMIAIKRAYEPATSGDGQRVLVDRVWPRGMRKDELKIDAWLRDVAPSTELRRWFGHDPARWPEFERRYREDLQSPERRALLEELAARAARGPLTLVYGARDPEHNQAAVLRAVLEARVGR